MEEDHVSHIQIGGKPIRKIIVDYCTDTEVNGFKFLDSEGKLLSTLG